MTNIKLKAVTDIHETGENFAIFNIILFKGRMNGILLFKKPEFMIWFRVSHEHMTVRRQPALIFEIFCGIIR